MVAIISRPSSLSSIKRIVCLLLTAAVRPLRSSCSGAASARGRRIRKVLPPPLPSLLALTEPPCS